MRSILMKKLAFAAIALALGLSGPARADAVLWGECVSGALYVEDFKRAAVAVGVSSLFIETHQDPDRAPSDGPNMIPLREMESLLTRLMRFDAVAKSA